MLRYYAKMEEQFHQAALKAKAEPEQLVKKIEDMQTQIRDLQAEIAKIKSASAKDALGDIEAEVVNGMNLVTRKLEGVDMNQLRELGDQIKEKIGEGVVALASVVDGKVNLIVTVTQGAMDKGAHAGNIIKAIAPIVGGGGGGRPNMAQAGGKNPAGIEEALEKVKTLL